MAAAPDDAASVKVTDDDAAATAPTFSVGDETANEDVGMMYFTVRLDRAVQRTVKVTVTAREASPVSARHGEDWQWWWPDGLALTFHPGQTEKKMWVYVYTTITTRTRRPSRWRCRTRRGARRSATALRWARSSTTTRCRAAWLARFGRTAAEQALDGIAGRIAAPRTAGVRGTIAGQALNLDPGSGSGAANDNSAPGGHAGNDLLAQSMSPAAFGAGGFGSGGPDGFGSLGFGQDRFGGAQSRSMTAREALLGSSFTATGEKDGTGGSLAFWGRAAQSSFDAARGRSRSTAKPPRRCWARTMRAATGCLAWR